MGLKRNVGVRRKRLNRENGGKGGKRGYEIEMGK